MAEDHDLPGLPTLLDSDLFITALRMLMPNTVVDDARITYLRYKPGTNCLASFRATIEGRSIHGYAKAYQRHDQDKLRRSERYRRAEDHGIPCHLILEELALGVWIFPNDHKLESLDCLVQPEARQHLMRKLLPERPDLWEGSLQQLRYKPERRYVAQLSDETGAKAVIKLYTEQSYRVSKNNAKALRSREYLRLARPLGHSQWKRALAFEWLQGQALNHVIASPDYRLRDIESVGRALSKLHIQSPKRLTHRSRENEAAELAAIAAGLTPISRELGRQATELSNRLGDRLLSQPRVIRPCHGDFYAGQVVLADDMVGVIDLDRAYSGDSAADIGLFIAHLERDELYGRLSRLAVDRLRDSFLHGYGTDGTAESSPKLGHIDLYTAIGLVRLAPEPFRYLEPDWFERIKSLLDRALQMVDRSESGRA